MRRGLMAWSKKEIPPAALQARIAGLREALQAAELDAFIAYTNLTRPGTVAHFAVFTPYWTDGLLVIPREGPTTLAVALSNRMKNWIQSTSLVDEIVCGPRPGKMAADALKASRPQRIGVVELDLLPAGIARDLQEGLAGAQLIDITVLAAALRERADETEAALGEHAATIARDALDAGLTEGAEDAGTLLGEIERYARLNGAEEIYLAAAPDLAADSRLARITGKVTLGKRFAVRASLAYKGIWIRLTRTVDHTANGWESAGAASARFYATLAALRGEREIGPTLKFAFPNLTDWMVEGTLGNQPLQVLGSAKWRPEFEPAPHALVTVTMKLDLKEGPWIAAAPLLVGEGRAQGRVLP
jgi:hypothetical protein